MMALLQELATLKELDSHFEANPADSEQEAYRVRQRRQCEIASEMRELAEQKKTADESPSD
jgi:hypothetical protein